MRLQNKNKAFSLTELLIVLVVVAVLFAALAPIITKRRNGSSFTSDAVWNYVNSDDQKDAYYDSQVPAWTSTAYIGVNPALLGDGKSPLAKLVIKSGSKVSDEQLPQRQIQFRYGSGNGTNAGMVFLDDSHNVMIAGTNDDFVNAAGSNKNAGYNTVAGMGAFANVISGHGAIAYGSKALKGATPSATNANSRTMKNASRYIAIGNKTLSPLLHNESSSSSVASNVRDNIFIGANSGQMAPFSSVSFNSNVVAGSNTMTGKSFAPSYSVYLGYLAGNAGTSTASPQFNVMVGSQYTGSGGHNTILGYGAFLGGSTTAGNITAAGYGACSSFNTNASSGSRTCIGYRSGGTKGSGTPSTFDTDSYDHVFLGGIPQGGFNGRSVVEVHNQRVNVGNGADSNLVGIHPTVIFNSNLVVRGNFFTPSNNGTLYSMWFDEVENSWSDARQVDSCRRALGIFGRKEWRSLPLVQLAHEPPYSSSFLTYGNNCNVSRKNYPKGGACPNLSDIRLKENITDNEFGIRELMDIVPYNYTFKEDKKAVPQTGVIAQQLQKIFPSAVLKGKDGYLRIRWDEMFFALINAIKSIDSKVEKLASDLTKMETDVKMIKTEHKTVQARINSLNLRAAKLEK